MKNKKYVALLRGINVGGNNIIKMVDLRASFEAMKFSDVETYIQSGNVVFSSDVVDRERLVKKIQRRLKKDFDYNSTVVLVSESELVKIVKKAPAGFGSEPDKYRYDVLFMKPELSPNELAQTIAIREGVDAVYVGSRVLYFSRLISQASKSYMSKITKNKWYHDITIRNWNTTNKLAIMTKK